MTVRVEVEPGKDLGRWGSVFAPRVPSEQVTGMRARFGCGAVALLVAVGRGEPVLVVTLDGEVLDTLTWVDVPQTTAILDFGPGQGTMYIIVSEFGTVPDTFAVNGTALGVVDQHASPEGSGVLRATWIDSDGDTTAVRDRPSPVQPFPDDAREEVISRLSESLAFSGRTPARIREVAEEQVHWPELAPALTSLLLGTDQRLWLRRQEQATPPAGKSGRRTTSPSR
jgi:hypothetical protein